jgi:hypothetical protein
MLRKVVHRCVNATLLRVDCDNLGRVFYLSWQKLQSKITTGQEDVWPSQQVLAAWVPLLAFHNFFILNQDSLSCDERGALFSIGSLISRKQVFRCTAKRPFNFLYT